MTVQELSTAFAACLKAAVQDLAPGEAAATACPAEPTFRPALKSSIHARPSTMKRSRVQMRDTRASSASRSPSVRNSKQGGKAGSLVASAQPAVYRTCSCRAVCTAKKSCWHQHARARYIGKAC